MTQARSAEKRDSPSSCGLVTQRTARPRLLWVLSGIRRTAYDPTSEFVNDFLALTQRIETSWNTYSAAESATTDRRNAIQFSLNDNANRIASLQTSLTEVDSGRNGPAEESNPGAERQDSPSPAPAKL